MLNGEYGIDDVCLSLLTVVGNKKAKSKILLPLNDEELKALNHSSDSLKEVIKSIKL